MSRLKKRVLQVFLAMACALGVAAGVAAPAQATTWYSYNGWCGTFYTISCSVLYTGAWPDGQVRAVGQNNLYEVGLFTRVGDAPNPYVLVAYTYPQTSHTAYTPIVPAGKANWYKACVKTVQGGPWLCSSQGAIYLGD
jgi:hypothetical protein